MIAPGSRFHPKIVALLAALLVAGCSNYRFRDARRPGGGYDLEKLTRDLEESRYRTLAETSWIPLVIYESTSFVRENPGGVLPARPPILHEPKYPPGYRLVEHHGAAPLFLYQHVEERHLDPERRVYEFSESTSLLWRLWSRSRTLVRTHRGIRQALRYDLLFGLLRGRVRVTYYGDGDTPLVP